MSTVIVLNRSPGILPDHTGIEAEEGASPPATQFSVSPSAPAPATSAQARRLAARTPRIVGCAVLAIGIALSPAVPLDFLINAPLAFLFAAGLAKVHAPLFQPAFALGMFLSILAGLPLMRLGCWLLGRPDRFSYTLRPLAADRVCSLGYTVAFWILTELGVQWPRPANGSCFLSGSPWSADLNRSRNSNEHP
jgi:hypothetical protein